MNYLETMPPIIGEADALIKGLFFALSPLYKKEFPCGQEVTVPLFTTLHFTSESILVLLMNQAVFDADILLRTTMEGTVKYCFLMTGESKERLQKIKEYKEELSEIDALTDHKKAVETVEILKEFSYNSTKPFELSILPDDVFHDLENRYSAKRRNELKHKWSYQYL